MSHTFVAKSGNYYFHNGDFSGDISLPVPVDKIPFEDLKELVAEYLKSASDSGEITPSDHTFT